MPRRITPACLLRSVFFAVLFAMLLHLAADYSGSHLLSEAGGEVARAI